MSSTTDKVNTKADQTALNALTGRVEKTEAGLTAANSNIVSLTAAVNAGNAAGDDYIPNPSFDPAYDRMGYDVVETTAAGVPADCPFRYAVRAGRARPCAKNQQHRCDTGRRLRNVCSGSVWYRQR
ncbi:hypothetical protein BB784_29005 (plasmid) [Klebsiella pneumoniae]|nr:hypothetical protein BB784_29005 [Klebsiella pneumoniae]